MPGWDLSDFDDDTEELEAASWSDIETDPKGKPYPSSETAWNGYYTIDRRGPVWQAMCICDGQYGTSTCDQPGFKVTLPSEAKTRQQIETHILRHGRPAIPAVPQSAEAPF